MDSLAAYLGIGMVVLIGCIFVLGNFLSKRINQWSEKRKKIDNE